MTGLRSSAGRMQTGDWLGAFQTVAPADGYCVAIGFLSSSEDVGYFRLHDDDGVDTKREKENRKIAFLPENSGNLR